MFAVMVLRAENWTIFCAFVCSNLTPSASAASLDSGMEAIREPMGTMAAAPTPCWSCSFLAFRCPASESHGRFASRSKRAAVCAKSTASGSLATATRTTSRSARIKAGAYCSADPFALTTSIMKPLSYMSSSAAYLNAWGSLSAISLTKPLSLLKAIAAPCNADPQPIFAASSRKLLSPRMSSLAPISALPFTLIASATKSRLDFRGPEASRSSSPLYFTASRMMARSPRSSPGANSSALPRLGASAAKSRSRSASTSCGADPSCVQSLRIMARQLAWR
mmetsp:Transcript_39364/g.112356  ORF Transcript_39364/g.112356 Transcript_39364/m.112356 type:complete len:279 (+) Transcript_39364:318-1154(+)